VGECLSILGICGLGWRPCSKLFLLPMRGCVLMIYSCPAEEQCLCDVYGIGNCS
jgi:hypothetical protein